MNTMKCCGQFEESVKERYTMIFPLFLNMRGSVATRFFSGVHALQRYKIGWWAMWTMMFNLRHQTWSSTFNSPTTPVVLRWSGPCRELLGIYRRAT